CASLLSSRCILCYTAAMLAPHNATVERSTRMSSVLGMLLVLFLMPLAGQAQEDKMQVSVVVSGDETIKPQVLRYIKNAMRNIQDVAIGDKSYTYQLHIVSLKVTEDVYSLSLFVLQKANMEEVFKENILYLYSKISDKLNDELGYYR